MSKRPTIEIWMPLHFADLTKACARMSELEECAFLRLLRDHWLNGSPPDDDVTLATITRLPLAKWKKARAALAPHFDLSCGRWVHVDTERRREHAISVSDAKKRPSNGGANATTNAPANVPANGGPNEDIRDLSSSSDRLVDHLPSQEGSTDSQDSSSANVIPLVGRDGR